MTDIARAVMLIEYDDGARTAYEWTSVASAIMTHTGLPGFALMTIKGHLHAIRQPGPVEATFIEAIATLEPPREEPHETGE